MSDKKPTTIGSGPAFQVISRYNDLTADREQIRALWLEIDRWAIGFVGKFRAYSNPHVLYNDAIFRARDILVSGLYSYLTNPASRWFAISPLPGQKLSQQELNWMSDATDKIYSAFAGSNFYQKLYQFYETLVNYGVALLYEEADDNGLKFISVSERSFVFDRDAWGNIIEVIVELKMSPEEVIENFGINNVSNEVITKAQDTSLATNPLDKIEILLSVRKNYGKKGKPYTSLWCEKNTFNLLKEGGYDTFPFFVGQWQVPNNEPYGTSPVINALSTVILANNITKTYWVNNEKLANPPLDVPYKGYYGDINISPGAINYRTDPNPQNGIRPIMTTGNINIDMEALQEIKAEINEKMFADLFMMLNNNPQMTATEVVQRNQEKMLMLGAIVGRLIHEVFTPLIYRTMMLLIANGILAPVDKSVKVEFLSPLAQTQKSSEFSSFSMLVNSVMQVAQFNPSVTDNINWDAMIRKVGEIYSVDNNMFISPQDMAQIRAQRQQVQAQQAQLQMQELQGRAMKQQSQAQLNAKKSEAIV